MLQIDQEDSQESFTIVSNMENLIQIFLKSFNLKPMYFGSLCTTQYFRKKLG